MLRRMIEGAKFKSPFTGSIFEVKKIYMNSVLLEEVENENHLVITEIGTAVSLYEKVEKR